MSAFILITGKLVRDPAIKATSKGSDYASATVRFEQKDRDGATEALFANVIAFRSEAQEVLGRLKAGDAVSVGGVLQVGVWSRDGEPKPSLSIVAETVATARPAPKAKTKPRNKPTQAAPDLGQLYGPGADGAEPFNDHLSF